MNDIYVSSDKALLDVDYIHQFLRQSYWASGISKPTVLKTIEHSYCFGLYRQEKQIGFARVITDYTMFAYLADVYIDPEEQNKGYGKWFVSQILHDKQLKDLKRWHLVTKDAQDFYKRLSFSALATPEKHMERYTNQNL